MRGRIDWKYALCLELDDPGFDHSVLTEFRDRLLVGGAGLDLLDSILDAAAARGLLNTAGRARTDFTHVLAVTRDLTRLAMVAETLRASLNAIAAADPTWLTEHAAPEWFERYIPRAEEYRMPKSQAKRTALDEQIATDGMNLLNAVYAADAPQSLRDLPMVQTLGKVWVQQYQVVEGEVRGRGKENRPPGALRLATPYGIDSRRGAKRDVYWDGYKVHLTESCKPDFSNLITCVATTMATAPDIKMTATVHEHLADRGRLPTEHYVDAGYVEAAGLVAARKDHNVDLVGPVAPSSVRKPDSGFSPADFTIDWDNHKATCPNGKTNAV